MPENVNRFPRGRVPLLFLLPLLAWGCTDEPTAPAIPVDEAAGQPGRTLGLVEVTLSGLNTGAPFSYALSAATVDDLEAMRDAARHRSGGAAGPRTAPFQLPDNQGGGADGTIQLDAISTGSFTEGTRGAGGVRYVWANFRVRNAQADGTPYDTPRENLTFLAVATLGTLGTSAISALDLFDGSGAASSLAEEIVPTGEVHRDTDGDIVSTGPDVLQVLTEAEAGSFAAPAGVNEVFPYGFVVRDPSNPSSRALAPNPTANQFDGLVTFAFKIPLQATPSDDPFTVSVVFMGVDDLDTSVTQSPEEQTAAGQAAFEQRATNLGASVVTLLPGGAYGGAIAQRTLCGARVAGLLDAPTAVVGGSCTGARGTIFVDADATGDDDGTSWTNAYTDLQDALAVANSRDEIWVAEGTYTPGAARAATFEMVDSVSIYGGFTGAETERSARNPDPATNGTVLSGDVNDDDSGGGSDAENNYRVVTARFMDDEALLDGFTITGGNANTVGVPSGGGVYNLGGSPRLANLRIVGNRAQTYGGGMYNELGFVALSDVIFEGNHAEYGGGMANRTASGPTLADVTFIANAAGTFGGGMYNDNSDPVLTGVTFEADSALSGGGMYDSNGSVSRLRNVTFTSNAATGSGGGMGVIGAGNGDLIDVVFEGNSGRYGGALDINGASPRVANTMFIGNTATLGGGAVSVSDGAGDTEPVFVNVLFSGNSATVATQGSGGGGLQVAGGEVTLANATFAGNTSVPPGGAIANYATVTLINSVLWGNTAVPGFAEQIWNTQGGAATVSSSILEDCGASGGGWVTNCGADGGGNRAGDPLFIDADGADDTVGTLDDNLRLDAGSDAVGFGDTAALPTDELDLDDDDDTAETLPVDLDGAPRVVNGTVDMGAYERQ